MHFVLFLIFSLISQIWILLFRIFLGDFVGLGKGELTSKRGEEKLDWTRLSLPSSLTSPLSFDHGPTWLNFCTWSKETEALESIKLRDLIFFYYSIYALNIGCSSVPIYFHD